MARRQHRRQTTRRVGFWGRLYRRDPKLCFTVLFIVVAFTVFVVGWLIYVFLVSVLHLPI